MDGSIAILSKTVADQVNRVGRAAVSVLFPRDVEYYMCALELATEDGDTIDYFSFPVMPSNISKTQNEKISVYHAMGSTVVLNSDIFVPQDLTISGDFGRNFKLVIDKTSGHALSFKGLRFSLENGVYNKHDVNSDLAVKQRELGMQIKSGYGCIKVIQGIINKAVGHDNGKNFRLYFYNPALGENYLVIPGKPPLVLTQDESKNMIWSYTLNLTILAPLDRLVLKKHDASLTKWMATDVVQAGVNGLFKDILKSLK